MKQLKNGRGLTDSQMGFLLIVPGLAVFLAIILYPFVDAVITSFTDRSLIYPDYKFVAFANYAKVFKDPYFGKTLITTLLFVLGSTVFALRKSGSAFVFPVPGSPSLCPFPHRLPWGDVPCR